MPRESLWSWQPPPHKGSRPLRLSKEVSQARRFVGVLYEASLPLPAAQLWERHTHTPPPETLLPQCVFEYYTWSNFWKSLIADGRILLGKC